MPMTRRRFVALAGGGAVAALAGDAWLVEPRRVQFTHHAVNARARPEQRAVRFVQITDLHLQAVGGMHRRIAAEVNRLAQTSSSSRATRSIAPTGWAS